MTRLLVSVRNAAEAALAVEAGADVVDVKEPSRGALGAADWSTIGAVVDVVAGRVPVSAALGELRDWSGDWPAGMSCESPDRLPKFVKFGLAGCGPCAEWPTWWRNAIAPCAAPLATAAVVYADWQQAGAPTPSEIIDWAVPLGCGAILVDTFDKQGGGLLDVWSLEALAQFVARSREAGLLVAVAGGLNVTSLEPVLSLEPDLVGVRGAACVAGRSSMLDARRVRQLAMRVRRVVDGRRSSSAALDKLAPSQREYST